MIKESIISGDCDLEPKNFAIVKIMTDKGERVAVCYSTDVSKFKSVLVDGLTFTESVNEIQIMSEKEKLDIYNKNQDEILGGVPEFMIDKIKEKTSYNESIINYTEREEIIKKREEIYSKIDQIETHIENIKNTDKDDEIKELKITLENYKSELSELNSLI